MKHTPIALLFAVLFAGCYSVTPVTRNNSNADRGGIFYALPSTTICVDFTYQYYNTEKALYSEYAAEMLALDSYNPEEPYRVKNVEVSHVVAADPQRFFLVNPRGLSVQVDNRHLLRAVGMTPAEVSEQSQSALALGEIGSSDKKLVLHNATADEMAPTYNLYDRTDTFYTKGDLPGHPTMTSTRKAPRSMRQRAQAAAEEYAYLEDTRNDVAVSDRYTAEGKAELLKNLEERETAILEQFVGRIVTETVHFYFTPEAVTKVGDSTQVRVLFYFSRNEGICDSDDVGAMPVVCTLYPDQSLQQVRRFNRKNNSKIAQSNNGNFKYRIPSNALMTLHCELFDFRVNVPVAQFGPIVNLPRQRFKALFDPATGALIYYDCK